MSSTRERADKLERDLRNSNTATTPGAIWIRTSICERALQSERRLVLEKLRANAAEMYTPCSRKRKSIPNPGTRIPKMGSTNCQRCNGEMIDYRDRHWYKYVCEECRIDHLGYMYDLAYDEWIELTAREEMEDE